MTGTEASESMLHRMSDTGRLGSYRYVHFATHGVVVPEVPELSALVLSQRGASDRRGARDGFLTMPELATLDLRADVAVLSACQTGVGPYVAGEGVISLAYAIFRGGANAALVSQWRVADTAAREFMTEVYRRAGRSQTSFSEAVTQAKRAFIRGEHGRMNADPARWAPFVYIGDE